MKQKVLEELIILINRLLEVSETLPNVALNSLLYIKQYAQQIHFRCYKERLFNDRKRLDNDEKRLLFIIIAYDAS